MAKLNKPLKPVTEYKNRNILHIQQQAALHERVLAGIKEVLPQELKNKPLSCVVKKNTLIIYTQSASWATQLRFYSLEMQNAIKTRLKIPLTKVHIRILPTPGQNNTQTRHVKTPALERINELELVARIFSDPTLKTALINLSKTLKRRKKQQ